MRIISGIVKSTPLPWLLVLSNIAPPKIRRSSCASRLINLLLFQELQNFPFDRLVSREPIWTSLEELKHFNIIDK